MSRAEGLNLAWNMNAHLSPELCSTKRRAKRSEEERREVSTNSLAAAASLASSVRVGLAVMTSSALDPSSRARLRALTVNLCDGCLVVGLVGSGVNVRLGPLVDLVVLSLQPQGDVIGGYLAILCHCRSGCG
jgi:hypothetical protein